jgi:hypothetical protein
VDASTGTTLSTSTLSTQTASCQTNSASQTEIPSMTLNNGSYNFNIDGKYISFKLP